jgi:type IV pilus assembly protein PilA
MKKLNNKGFSLVELMVVVAIIGILSAIAIPNFQRFQRKSRQSEAKSLLGGIYSAEKAFHQEWNQYFSDLDVVGYVPNGQLRYLSGFLAASTPALPSGYQGPAASGRFTTALICAAITNQCNDLSGGPALTGAVNPAGSGNSAAFTASATTANAQINAVAGTNDAWTMNNMGVLSNNVSGI